MNSVSYAITGGDFVHVGLGANNLKERLKKLGVPPDSLRRVVIAAYEAEANVVVHARKGTLCATLGPTGIDVEVTDEGPGIPDIELAMKEGFSTASATAAALGFGAGMGLTNIKKNSGSFMIESEVGRGTRVRFSVHLSPQKLFGPPRNSLCVVRELCRKCMRCLHACPTRALRIRQGGPEVLEHLCIDCGACIDACEAGALGVPDDAGVPTPSERTCLLVPASLLVDFGPSVGAQHVMAALAALGFHRLRVTEEWGAALRLAALAYAREEARTRPVFSPECPAVVNLVETRFPSLLPHVAPFLSPLEAACEDLAGQHVVAGISCPAQHTVLRTGRSMATLLNASRLRHAVSPMVAREMNAAVASPWQPVNEDRGNQGVFRVSGLRHVINILEQAENGLLADFVLVELMACEQGCFGTPVSGEEPFLAWHRWQCVRRDFAGPARAFRRKDPFVARSGMRLDDDMSRAIRKLHQIDVFTASLPGRDCGMCGAPTCREMAEDVVLERARRQECPRRTEPPEEDR
ncbi:[Fe-Fe] hydrogenase large subunit C-terminal domain-containing protein [Planctomycetota bacterium]